MRKITKEQRLFDKQSKDLRKSQRYKTNKEILSELDYKEAIELSEGSIKLGEVFGLCGVYMLFLDSKLVYIGESNCITTRISQHFKDEIKEFDSYKIYSLIEDTSIRKREEKRLIKKYNPILNFTHNRSLKLIKSS